LKKKLNKNMTTWINFPENPEDYIGFIYYVKNTVTGNYYIGKKQLLKKTRLKANKTRKRDKIVWKDNDVEKYYGSSSALLADIEELGKDKFERHVIEMCTSKWHMSYSELMWQIEFNALMDENSYNGILNIRLNKAPKNYIDIERKRENLNL
tara:strand:+ start:371 stop:826 length:456 start_codon:yes stop_codon:yes gene_type:complete